MPCGDGGHPDASYEVCQLRMRLDNVTELLCATCQVIDFEIPGAIKKNPALSKWWEDHKRLDELKKNINSHKFKF